MITKVHLVGSEAAAEAMRLWEDSKSAQDAKSYAQTVQEVGSISIQFTKDAKEHRSGFVSVATADVQGRPVSEPEVGRS